MKLSVMSDNGEQILAADLLRSGSMRAGDDGLALARTLNNLALLASAPEQLEREVPLVELTHPEAGHAPFPWRVNFDRSRWRVAIRDAEGRLIAERRFPKRMRGARAEHIVDMLVQGVALE